MSNDDAQAAQRVREIRERVDAATPGPWHARATDDEAFMNARYVGTEPCPRREPSRWPILHDNLRGMDYGSDEQEPSGNVVAITLLQSPRLADIDDQSWDENTQFIAHAREDIPWLLAERDALTAERDAATARAEAAEALLSVLKPVVALGHRYIEAVDVLYASAGTDGVEDAKRLWSEWRAALADSRPDGEG